MASPNCCHIQYILKGNWWFVLGSIMSYLESRCSGKPWFWSIFLPNLLPFGSCRSTISYAIWFLSHYYTNPNFFGVKSWIEVKRKTVLSDFLENFTYNYYLESDQNRTGCIVAPQQELVSTRTAICEVWHAPWRRAPSQSKPDVDDFPPKIVWQKSFCIKFKSAGDQACSTALHCVALCGEWKNYLLALATVPEN